MAAGATEYEHSDTSAEALTTAEAIEVLAGGPVVRTSTAYRRLYARLRAEANRGRVAEEVGGRYRRYRRDQVEALAAAFEREGITRRPTSRRRVIEAAGKEGEALGLIGTQAISEATGIPADTIRGWGQRGLYGARRIRGCWFFDPAAIASRPARAPKLPLIEVPCDCCGQSIKRKASEVRRREALAATAGRKAQWFCDDCWPGIGKHHSLIVGQRGRGKSDAKGRANVSAAVRRQWEDDKRSRADAARRMAAIVSTLLKSPKRIVGWQDARLRGRHGRPLLDDERAQLEARARSRAQADTDRSRATRHQEERLRELWGTNATVDDIAKALGTTASNVKQMRRRLSLPRRPTGRRPKEMVTTFPTA